MGRPPKRPEDLSPGYLRRREGMTEAELFLCRARQADSVYYSGVRKRAKMSDEYLRAGPEMRERIVQREVEEAERWRLIDKKTWQQKAEAHGFTRNANGQWEQDVKILRRCNNNNNNNNNNLPNPSPTTTQHNKTYEQAVVQETEVLCKGNPTLRTIMFSLTELGGTLNRSELEAIEMKVQELIQADEYRRNNGNMKSNAALVAVTTTPTKPKPPTAFMIPPFITPASLAGHHAAQAQAQAQEGLNDLLPAMEEPVNRKRKRQSSCDSRGGRNDGTYAHCEEKKLGRTPINESGKPRSATTSEHFEIPKTPTTSRGTCTTIGLTAQPPEQLSHHQEEEIIEEEETVEPPDGPDGRHERDARTEQPESSQEKESPNIIRPATEPPSSGTSQTLFSSKDAGNDKQKKKIKVENGGGYWVGNEFQKPVVRTGFFDNVRW